MGVGIVVGVTAEEGLDFAVLDLIEGLIIGVFERFGVAVDIVL